VGCPKCLCVWSVVVLSQGLLKNIMNYKIQDVIKNNIDTMLRSSIKHIKEK
jgi:hypothetical protein